MKLGSPTKLERFGRLIDGVVEAISPARAYRRRAARLQIEALSGGYRGATKERPREGWNPGSGSADQDLVPDLPTLRERSRDLNRNDGTAKGLTATMVDNIVGTGIRPQCRLDARRLGITPEQAKKFQDAAERAWWDWEAKSDAAGRLSFRGQQRLALGSTLENGDVFVHPVMVARPGRALDLHVQLFEADRVDTPKGSQWLQESDKIRGGVEVGRLGEPVAYWVSKEHPGITGRSAPTDFVRMPAVDTAGRPNVLQLFRQTRVGQNRGEPLFASVLTLFDDMGGFRDAEMTAARVASFFAAFVTTSAPASRAAGRGTQTTSTGQRIETLESGSTYYLGPEEKVDFGDPKRPNSTFEAFINYVLRTIGASIGVPYELVARDFSKTNYSSARAALLEARRMFRSWQDYLIDAFCQPIWAMVIEEAWLRGLLPDVPLYDDFEAWTCAHWVTPGWGWVDPVKEIQASVLAIKNGLSTKAEECASQGRDWEEVAAQREAEREDDEERGLVDAGAQPPAAPTPPAAPQPPGGGPQPQPTEQPAEEEAMVG